MQFDHHIRLAAFNWLSEKVQEYGDEVLPRTILAKGFKYQGSRIPLVSPQGIFKPKHLELPLTITTAPKGPYKDRLTEEDLLHYKYRGTNPQHRDNVGLRKAMQEQVPLIYFYGVIPGKYLAVWPVYIVGDNPDSLIFTVAADYQLETEIDYEAIEQNDTARRRYHTATIKSRLHQKGFRERVLAAYQSQCSFCQLKRTELLDASHIISDEEEGPPTVDNGLALCKIHHTAYDRMLIGVTPDYVINVRRDVLDDEDGPMLLHGLQELHGRALILPKKQDDWPNKEYLDWRYERFKEAV